MGSGDRVIFGMHRDTIGLGLYFSRFPFEFTINGTLLMFYFSIGFGKGYDEK
jgi:hypothetical protein